MGEQSLAFDVYVLREDATSLLSREFVPGTAFVRIDHARPRSCFYFEGNLYDAVNLRRFVERALCAAGRGRESYPTTAKAWFSTEEIEENFVLVGSIDGNNVVTLTSEGVRLVASAVGADSIGPYESEALPAHEYAVGGELLSIKAPDTQSAHELFMLKISRSELASRGLGLVYYKAPGEEDFSALVVGR